MQVNVYVPRHVEELPERLLLLPASSDVNVAHWIMQNWSFYETLDSASPLFHGVAVELHIQAKGFVVVEHKHSSVWC